jgi:hypothetical protein
MIPILLLIVEVNFPAMNFALMEQVWFVLHQPVLFWDAVEYLVETLVLVKKVSLTVLFHPTPVVVVEATAENGYVHKETLTMMVSVKLEILARHTLITQIAPVLVAATNVVKLIGSTVRVVAIAPTPEIVKK